MERAQAAKDSRLRWQGDPLLQDTQSPGCFILGQQVWGGDEQETFWLLSSGQMSTQKDSGQDQAVGSPLRQGLRKIEW